MIRLVVKNSVSNIMVPVFKICITFIMAPLIIKALGNYDYGIWEIVFSIVGYMGILDVGLGPAITRYVARYNAMQNQNELRKIYSTSLLFLGSIGGLLFLSFAAWAAIAPGILAETGSAHTRYAIFLLIIGIQVFFTFTGSVFESFHEGFQQYNIRNNITIVNSIIGSAILYILLQKGHGLLALALVNAIGFSSRYLIYGIILSLPRFGGFRFRKKDLSWNSLRELFSFGLQSLIQAIALRISTATDSLVIGSFLGPVAVTFFIIPVNLINQIRTFVWALTRAFMPLFSDLDAKGETEKTAQILMVASRYVLGVVLPTIGIVCFLGLPFISIWIGPEYADKGRWVLYIFVAAYLLNWINPFSNRLLTGMGRQGILARISIASAAVNLTLSLFLVQYLGKEGVALGTLIPAVIFEPIILYYTCKHIGKDTLFYVREVILPLLIPNLLLIAFLWIITNNIEVNTYFNIISVSLVSIILYVFLFFAISIGKDEQRFILNKIKERTVLNKAY